MNLPAKKYITFIGIIGIMALISGLILLTFSLIKAEKTTRIGDGIKTTARVISVFEDSCTRGRWSSKCYDISILFTDESGNMVTTILEDEFDRPKSEQIPIIYNKNKPETAVWDIVSKRSWLDFDRITSYFLMIAGLLIYAGSLAATRLASRRDAGRQD